jgi:hypothetical protein
LNESEKEDTEEIPKLVFICGAGKANSMKIIKKYRLLGRDGKK